MALNPENLMILDLLEVRKGTADFQSILDPREWDLTDLEATFPDPLSVKANVQKVESKMVISGTLTTRAGYTCSRCLEPFTADLEVPFAFYCQTKEESAGLDKSETDEIILYNEQDVSLDLTDHIREQIILALPSKPLCREDCKGICAGCGASLNTESCTCSGKNADVRWGKLKELKNKRE